MLTYWVDHEHALHDLTQVGGAGVRQGVVHPLHYGLEQARLVLCLERQSALRILHNICGTSGSSRGMFLCVPSVRWTV